MTDWLIEGLLLAGAVMVVADLDDPTPAELFAQGVDVVVRLHDQGDEAFDDAVPMLLSVHWRPGLVPGRKPPAPFWVRFDPGRGGFVRIGEAA